MLTSDRRMSRANPDDGLCLVVSHQQRFRLRALVVASVHCVKEIVLEYLIALENVIESILAVLLARIRCFTNVLDVSRFVSWFLQRD